MRAIMFAAAFAFAGAANADGDAVAVFDRGGGASRVAIVEASLAAQHVVVVAADEAGELDARYAAACDDAACYARAAVAGGIVRIALVAVDHVAVVSVGADGIGHLQRLRATDAELGASVLALLTPGQVGAIVVDAAGPVRVDGVAWSGEDVVVGRHVVEVGGAAPWSATVDVVAGAPTRVAVPSSASSTTSNAATPSTTSNTTPNTTSNTTPTPSIAGSGVNAGVVVGAVGGGIVVVGAAAVATGALLWSGAGQPAIGDSSAKRDAIGTGVAVENLGWVGVGVGAAVGVVGVVLALASDS